MTEIISVRFKSGGRQYYFDPVGMTIEPNQGVIVETSRGLEYGECVQGNREVEDSEVVPPLRPTIRVATDYDLEVIQKNKEREKQAFSVCQEKILEHKLDMKLVSVEQNFEGNKLLFFFTAENRVDFRALVKDLAATFHTRIELRQIGVRDEAKLLGGLGICGKPFCCSSFLGEFQPVSIKMAKTQNLSLNPTKISGTCGRLMCCLKYEQDAYEDAVRRCPKHESFVETPDGVGTVTGVNLLREQVKVHIEDSDDPPKTYLNTEINVVRSGKGKRPEGYVTPSKGELAKLRRISETLEEKKDVKERTPLSAALESIFSHGQAGESAQETSSNEKNSGHNRRRGENPKTEFDSRKNGGDNRRNHMDSRKMSTNVKKNSSDGNKVENKWEKSTGESRKGNNDFRKTNVENKKNVGDTRKIGAENGDKRVQEVRGQEKRRPAPSAPQHQKMQGEDKKPLNQKFRRTYRGKPRNGGGSNGNQSEGNGAG